MQARATIIPPSIPGDDAWRYWALAVSVVHGHGYALAEDGGPTALWAPGYVFWLAGFVKVFGARPAAIVAANLPLQALGVSLVWFLGRRLGGLWTGTIAALGYGLLPSVAAITAVPLTENLADPMVAAVLLVVAARDGRKVWDWILVAAMISVATLARPATILMAAVVLAYWRDSLNMRRVGAACVTGLLLLVPWTIRNASTPNVGPAFVTTEAGYNLWLGNNANADGCYSVPPGFHGAPGARNQAEAGAYYTRQAVRWVASSVGRLPWLVLEKLGCGFGNDDEMIGYWLGIGRQGNALTNLAQPLINIGDMLYAVLLGMGVLGSLLVERRLLGMTIAVIALPIVIFFGSPRFHAPMLGVLALGSARLAVTLCRKTAQEGLVDFPVSAD